MIPRVLIERIFTTANMRRWSDLATFVDFYELDKQSLKAVYTYTIAKYQEQNNQIIDYRYLIEGLVFEFLKRAVLTDIKPQVYHKLASQKANELNEFVLSILKKELQSDIYNRCEAYITNKNQKPIEQSILNVAHTLSTKWEYDFIHNSTKEIYTRENISAQLDNTIKSYLHLDGVREVLFDANVRLFVNTVATLRFQTRWNNLPRIPKTSVLGHTFIVGVLSYMFGIRLDYCDRLIYNNFFDGLFHDLAEALTRDIISPIKYSIKGLDSVLKEYESELITNEILPLLPSFFCDEIVSFTLNEFDNMANNTIVDDIQEYNTNSNNPKDGKLVKICDNLSAYYEASISIDYGVSSKELIDAKQTLQEKYNTKQFRSIDLGAIFSIF